MCRHIHFQHVPGQHVHGQPDTSARAHACHLHCEALATHATTAFSVFQTQVLALNGGEVCNACRHHAPQIYAAQWKWETIVPEGAIISRSIEPPPRMPFGNSLLSCCHCHELPTLKRHTCHSHGQLHIPLRKGAAIGRWM